MSKANDSLTRSSMGALTLREEKKNKSDLRLPYLNLLLVMKEMLIKL